ncbi:MAG: hypothetical protein AB9Q19_00485 [Candidatus Reddybacter sp.]
MMRIKNTQAAAPAPAITPARLNAILQASASKGYLSFDDVRASEGKTAEQLPDGAIHQAALDAGLEVEKVAPAAKVPNNSENA